MQGEVQMRKLTVLLIAALLMTAYTDGADASARAHRKHSAFNLQKRTPTQPVQNPVTRLPLPADTFRA
jgi:hypothetical protein